MIPFPNEQYNIIYADPPWTYKVWSKKGAGRTASSHYDALFMWATYPNLKEAFEVIDAWGFTYKTVAFTWTKTYNSGKLFVGMGYWTRANCEICLLATKGKPKRQSKSVPQALVHTINKHSKKPDVIRHRIEELMGDLPRIELFARERTEGWDAWGNEVPDECQYAFI